MPKIGNVKHRTLIKVNRKRFSSRRNIVQASLGPVLDGYSYPHPDDKDTKTKVAGILKRFCFEPPTPRPGILDEFERFVKEWVRQLPPLSVDTDVSFENWLAHTDYPEWRKQELREVHEMNLDKWDRQNWKVKSFVKDEVYPSFKHARIINARSDCMKITFGPYFKAIEKVLYARPEFIKKIPVNERPQYIMERLTGSGYYVATDYTAFESLFTSELMYACEFVLYEHMLAHVEGGQEMLLLMHEVLRGTNECDMGDVKISVEATRMSGEMNTSLGNGFTNLMAMLFVAHLSGVEVKGVVEGDDGLFLVQGGKLNPDLFAELGLVIKLEEHTEISKASFCGLIFDEEEMSNVADPRKILLEIGWTTRQYAYSRSSKKLSLLRAKALSLAYQYPGCPIAWKLAERLLYLTRSADVRWLLEARSTDSYARSKLMEVLRSTQVLREPGIRTRLLVQEKFGITVSEQLLVEEELSKIQLEPFTVTLPFEQATQENSLRYVFPVSVGENYPGGAIRWSRAKAYSPFGREHQAFVRGLRLD